MTSPKPGAPSPRARARRMHEKAAYDPATIEAVLDAVPLAHVGHVVDGFPVVTPTLQWRVGGRIFWHGSSASRMMKRAAGAQVCVTVTALDGMVLARSGLEHSVNYRSVMVFGAAEPVKEAAAKEAALKAMMDRLFPGRWEALRPMTAQELKATVILSLPIAEATAKIDAGPPNDPDGDLTWPVWAGNLPLIWAAGAPVPAPGLAAALAAAPPAYLAAFRFG